MNHDVELIETALAQCCIEYSPSVIKGVVANRDIFAIDEGSRIQLHREEDRYAAGDDPQQKIDLVQFWLL